MNCCITVALTTFLSFTIFKVISTSATEVSVNNDIITAKNIIMLATLQKNLPKAQEFSILEFFIKLNSINVFGKIITKFKNAGDTSGLTISWLPIAINGFQTKIFKDLTSYSKAIEVLGFKIESPEQLNVEEGLEKVVTEATELYNHCFKEITRLKELQYKAHREYKSYHKRSQRLMENNVVKSNLQQLILIARHYQMI